MLWMKAVVVVEGFVVINDGGLAKENNPERNDDVNSTCVQQIFLTVAAGVNGDSRSAWKLIPVIYQELCVKEAFFSC